MVGRVSVLGLVIVFACWASSALGATADTQIGDWVFALPSGCRIKTGTNGQPVITHRATPDHLQTSIFLLGGVDLREPTADWLRREWKGLEQTFRFGQVSDPAESRTSAGASLGAIAGRGANARGLESMVVLAGIRIGDRAAPILLITNDFTRIQDILGDLNAIADSATFASTRPKNAPLPKLAIRIDPTSTPSFLWDPAPPLPRGDAGLEGIYAMSRLEVSQSALTQGGDVRFGYRYYTFFADGRVLREMPPEGLLSFRADFWEPHFVNGWGRYRKTEDAVEMTFRTPRGEDHETLTVRDGQFFDGTKPVLKLRGDRAKLEGRFLRVDHKQFAESQLQGITFARDGRFEDEAFNSTLNIGWWSGGDYSLRDLDPVPGKGKWRVARHTLELIYDDGRRRRFGVHLYGDEPEDGPKAFVINGRVMVRVP